MTIKNIFTSIVLISLIWISFYLNWFYWIINIFFGLFIYYTIAYGVYFLWKTIRKKDIINYKEFAIWFLYKISLFIVIISSIIWGFAYYNNKISPAPMPEFTLQNDKGKEVIFQAMSHIWTWDFYETIQNNLRNYKKTGWIYFYEWVKPGSEENMRAFDEAIWIKFDKDLYANFSKLYWVINQDNTIYYNLINNLDFNVDLSIDEIMELYNKNPKQDKSITPPIDATKTITDTLTSLNEKELKILVYINQAILNFIIKSEKTQELITNNFWNQELFDVILNKRNDVLANAIIESKYNNIYITYWLLHFAWVLELLQKNDSSWKVTKITNLYPIK